MLADDTMPRGPHAADPQLFAQEQLPVLRAAVEDLSWLLGRGYAEPSAVKLVGDRYALRVRQRNAMTRAACSDAQRDARQMRREREAALRGKALAIDGFNCIITTESALCGGVLVRGRDGALRDLASVHGSYRRIDVTHDAIAMLGRVLLHSGVRDVTWWLDRPVSNSGRLRDMLLLAGEALGQTWQVELAFDPDRALAQTQAVVATADGAILDACGPWIDLASAAIAAHVPDAWIVDLGSR